MKGGEGRSEEENVITELGMLAGAWIARRPGSRGAAGELRFQAVE